MDETFVQKEIRFLDGILNQTNAIEESQEIRLTDSMPDIGQVICGWGQPILRGKTWQGDSIAISGGIMVWVLYLDENGQKQCVEGWVPFSVEVPLDRDQSTGEISASCLPGSVDVRQISPRKLSVRCGGWVNVTCLSQKKVEIYEPGPEVEGVELQRVRYPVRLKQEAGEKSFLMEEELKLPESQRVIYYRLEPKITDQKVLSDKLVFRGCGMLHLLYETETGMESRDFEVPFSQFAQLDRENGEEAKAEISFALTSLELEPLGESVGIKAGLTAQYCISDMSMLELVEDAYSPCRELELTRESFWMNLELDRKKEEITATGKIAEAALYVADRQFLPAMPRQKGDNVVLSGTFQTLYLDGTGMIKCSTSKWEDGLKLPCDESSNLSLCWGVPRSEALAQGVEIVLKAELPLEIRAVANQAFSMVTGVKLGEKLCQDPGRPSLILRRAGNMSLWEMAKASGSTVEAIRQANDLISEPVPGQMLLIPVP